MQEFLFNFAFFVSYYTLRQASFTLLSFAQAFRVKIC